MNENGNEKWLTYRSKRMIFELIAEASARLLPLALSAPLLPVLHAVHLAALFGLAARPPDRAALDGERCAVRRRRGRERRRRSVARRRLAAAGRGEHLGLLERVLQHDIKK